MGPDPNVKIENNGTECIARTNIPNSLTQFSQIDVFYHTWHTRLVTELWRISGESKFYATAIRWNQYLAEKRAQDELKPDGEFFEPLFNVADSTEDDELLKLALQGRDPVDLMTDEIRRRIDDLANSRNLPSDRAGALLNRAGLRQKEQPN